MKTFKLSQFKLPRSFYNYTTYIGAIIALMNVVFIIFTLLITFIFEIGSAYTGLVTYIILPSFMMGGLFLIPIGALVTRRKLKKQGKLESIKAWPTIDFNEPRTRNMTLVFGIGSIVLFLFSAVGSYEAFHYTESVEFCGTLCHKVMEPEYVAYHESSHERVSCVSCHVGDGATWYVKSKLSGMYQVYAVLTDIYPRPIPTPIVDLRPARETCEECHWPEKFYENKLKVKRSFLADEQNTAWDIHLQMKTSAKHSAMGNSEGIHWHINPQVKIEYIALDAKRSDIPWVRYTNLETGESIVYQEEDNRLSQSQIDSLQIRTMDCLDCHNRPSHDYKIPQNFIDAYMITGEISSEIPDIKSVTMGIFAQDYPTKDSAFTAIEAQVLAYYQNMYPDFLAEKKQVIVAAIASIQDGYSKNIFPEMGVNWSEYPNHLGHLESPGCNRCHNDKHISSEGRFIPRDCNLCHLITAQGSPDTLEISNQFAPLEFKHPVDMGKAWQTDLCSDCHSQLY